VFWAATEAVDNDPWVKVYTHTDEKYYGIIRDHNIADSDTVATDAAQVDGNPAIRIDTKRGTPGSMVLDIRKNGGAKLAGTGTDFDVGAMDDKLDRFAVGASMDTGTVALFLTGDIAEILIYSRALTNAEHDTVLNYLEGRYAITITAVS
jgi:hypothetical protein